jgi:hypothetical protein
MRVRKGKFKQGKRVERDFKEPFIWRRIFLSKSIKKVKSINHLGFLYVYFLLSQL